MENLNFGRRRFSHVTKAAIMTFIGLLFLFIPGKGTAQTEVCFECKGDASCLTDCVTKVCAQCDDGNPCTTDRCLLDTNLKKGGYIFRGCEHKSLEVMWYLDADKDGYYTESKSACPSPGPEWVTYPIRGGGDCDDSNPKINPGAAEIENNGIDDNCKDGDKITESLSVTRGNPIACAFDNGYLTIEGLIADKEYKLQYASNGRIYTKNIESDVSGKYKLTGLRTGIYELEVIIGTSHLLPLLKDTLTSQASPTWFSNITSDFELCEGMTLNIATLGSTAPAGTVFRWLGPNDFVSTPRIDDPNFTLVDVTPDNNGDYVCVGWSLDYCTDTIVSKLTVVPPANLAINTGTGSVCESVDANAAYAPECSIISRQVPNLSDPNSLSGVVNSCVTVTGDVQTINSLPYVPRYYEIEPEINPSAATATITLYALQSEFDAYNAYVTANSLGMPLMPVNGVDNGNVRISQFHGDGSVELIVPALHWLSSLDAWQITFNVVGFSRFYIHSGATVLPVKLISFVGSVQNGENVLRWRCTEEQSVLHYDVERSYDAVHFETVGTVAAHNAGNYQNYSYSDPTWDKGASTVYYQLKIVEQNGRYAHSSVIALSGPSLMTLSVIINSSAHSIYVRSSNLKQGSLFDISGRELQRVNIQGSQLVFNTSRLSKGIYLVKVTDINGNEDVRKIVLR